MVKKLHISENIHIVEDIEAIKKYYPNIDDNMFIQLIELDPTYREGSDSAGKYGKWLLNLYNKGNLSTDEFKDVPDILNQFTTYKNRIQNKDLNSYKSLNDLADVLATVVNNDSMLTDRQKVRFLKNVKNGKIKTSAEDDYDIVLDTPKFVVYVPNTHEASMKLGKGTDWCTAHENPEWYENYTKNGSKLYIVKNKETGERWQYSDETEDFLDENDNDFDIGGLLKQDRQLSKFFAKFLGFDCCTVDTTWFYDGKEIPTKMKSIITEIIISDDVTKIGIKAFELCTSLKSITIPNSITKILFGAFAHCSSLTSITIPDSVIRIGVDAFTHCSSLTSVTIPDSVREIGIEAFAHCSSLTSITIPDSVREIGVDTFTNCPNLTIYTNNEYVINYCNKYNISVKSLVNTESYKRKLRLHINEN